MLGAPTMLLAGVLARELPQHAGAIVLAASSLAIIVGLIARAVARPLGPEQSRWLNAIDAASRGALQPEPDAAIRAALESLSRTTATAGARPELWRSHPEQVLSVDVAGYLHCTPAQAPARLYELALAEPERTLRAEVLQAVQVRRPDVRPLVDWFDARRGFSATVIVDEDGPLGFILLPRGSRRSVMALEEARAVRLLADRISSLLAVSSALARSRQRELAALQRTESLEEELRRLQVIIQNESGRHRLLAQRHAEVIRRAAYSAAARLTLDTLERLGKQEGPIGLICLPGVDVVGWAAVAHLASERNGGPLVVVDATYPAEQDEARWTDATESPLQLADGGTLLVLEAPALPTEVQIQLTRQLAHRAPSQEPTTIPRAGLVLALGGAPEQLAQSGRLNRVLARALGEATVTLPGLAERAEDLRALVLANLSRAGLQLHGTPLGVDPAALRLLMEHSWPGNELELQDVLTRAARAATGKVVTPADLASARFIPDLEPASSATPPPAATGLRSHARRRTR